MIEPHTLDLLIRCLIEKTNISAQYVASLENRIQTLEKQTTTQLLPSQTLSYGRTLSDWVREYEDIIQDRNYSSQTIGNKRSCRVHVISQWGSMTLSELRASTVSRGIADISRRQSSHVALRVLIELRDILKQAVLNDLIPSNPALGVDCPHTEVKRRRLSLDTFISMLNDSKARSQKWMLPLLLLAVVTGQRRDDLGKMKFDDIHDNHLHVIQSKKCGKKEGPRVRIPLDIHLDALNISLKEIVDHCLVYYRIGDTLLRKKNGSSIEKSSLSARFNQCIRRVLKGETLQRFEWPSLHEVRSLSARLYHSQGLDVQTLLGHASFNMTEIYLDERDLAAKDFKSVQLLTS